SAPARPGATRIQTGAPSPRSLSPDSQRHGTGGPLPRQFPSGRGGALSPPSAEAFRPQLRFARQAVRTPWDSSAGRHTPTVMPQLLLTFLPVAALLTITPGVAT